LAAEDRRWDAAAISKAVSGIEKAGHLNARGIGEHAVGRAGGAPITSVGRRAREHSGENTFAACG